MVYQYRRSGPRSDARLTDAFGVGRRYPYTMGLRCLLGHEYANREVEREREERGDEVVVTYRTVETCDRCGERRVVSENKEVRPIRDPREDDVATGLGGGVTAGLDEPPADDDASAPSEETPATGGASATADGADGSSPATTASTDDDGREADDDGDPTPDPAEEDAVILDDGATDDGDDRARGEWPGGDAERPEAEAPTEAKAEAETGAEADPTPADDGTTVVSGDEGWPQPGGEDEGFDAEPNDGTPMDVSFGGGVTPEGNDAAANGEAEGANGAGAVAGKQFVAAEDVEPVSEESAGRTEFFCPNCGYVRTAGGSSMRAGDICPDCHKGYIAERERTE